MQNLPTVLSHIAKGELAQAQLEVFRTKSMLFEMSGDPGLVANTKFVTSLHSH